MVCQANANAERNSFTPGVTGYELNEKIRREKMRAPVASQTPIKNQSNKSKTIQTFPQSKKSVRQNTLFAISLPGRLDSLKS